MSYNSKYTGIQVEKKLDEIDGKQDTLVSGKNIKTINGYSILGSGNLTISGGGGDVGYSAKISLMTPQFNAVLKDSAGHYIEFTFDTTNGAGESMGEGVTCTYTITRGTNQSVITEKYRYNTKVRFGVDKYLQEGANDIVINIVGDISGLSTSIGVTFQVVNLVLDTQYDLSRVYDLSNKSYAIVEVPFTLSGYGTKIMEWYVDGEALAFVKDDDEVVDVTTTRTKYITISNLAQGTHSLQVRAYTVVNGEQFFTDTFYYDMIVYTGVNQELIISVSAVIPSMYGILKSGEQLKIYNAVQYETYTLKFATYSPTSASSTLVSINVNNDEVGVVSSINGIENKFRYIPTTYGSKTLILRASGKEYIVPMIIGKTSMNIDEITTALALDFNAGGRSNNSTNKDSWSFGNYKGTFNGFNWNETSGWVNGRLEMNAGSSLAIDYAPLATQPTNTGKTIEIEWMTKNVTNDNAVICDLRGENGVGILITATKVSMTSADGVTIDTEYKSDETVRIGFVINKVSGVANQKMSFIYSNGILARGEKWEVNDNYNSDKQILFSSTTEAEVSLKSIRIYDIALTSDQMLNNYTLYRDTVAEMLEVYHRNDIYIDGTTTFSPDKMMSRLPVMIVTGDIPTLENTSDKDTQIVVDIEYNNLQNPSKSFKMKGAAMRPQGTSSMGYPKKNFRIYTQKVDGTVLYDANGDVVEDKLYAFTEKAQPVDCWCLKADYAESSGTHNTGIARLWNEALINAQVEGEYVCRTEAQKAAIEAGYEYDVRTTIDGFPILLFYRPTENDNVIFIGKYNFNNDKSTESVFGFKGIPNFNNEKMQCWEVLNNGNALALFTTVDGFDEGWAEAFESRYPDTKTPHTGDLKAFCEWMVNVSQEDFAVEKWEHLNVYMIAAYWCYLMRHAAADQFVKNAMFTSEDGQHFYYILYDNDTINGLINTGHLEIEPTDDRQTRNASGEYVFAGHDSRLWNMLEADEEFKNIVSSVDNALYSAGISYANTIKMFDEEQADKWVEKVYNQDAQYKYVGPYIEKGINNLFMLQGKRDLHRKWWLAKRFSIYDAKYVSGTYKSQAIELKCINGTPSGQTFKVTAGYPLDYGYGINNVPREFGIPLSIGESKEFVTREVVNRGDPIRIYGAPHISELDLSKMSSTLAVVTIANVYDDALGTKLTKLIVGKEDITNLEVSEISGLKQAISLEYLDIQGMKSISSLDLTNHTYLKTLKACGSGISSVTFAKGAPVERIELPTTMRAISLEQLPYLEAGNIEFENISSLASLVIKSCPNVSNEYSFVKNWLDNKTTIDSNCSLIMDGVDWVGVSGEQMARIATLGNVSLKGKIVLTSLTEEQNEILVNAFGNNIFNENAELFIDAPITVTISGVSSLLEGDETTYAAKVFPSVEGTLTYSLLTSRVGCTIDTQSGKLKTIENGAETSDIIVRATFTPANGDEAVHADIITSIVKRTYPSNITIEGNGNLLENVAFTWKTTTPEDEINGEYDVEWSINGGLASYYAVVSNGNNCELRCDSIPEDTTTGTLTLTLKKKVDGTVVGTATLNITHTITWLSEVTIVGSNNPVENPNYTWSTESEYSGIVASTWSLSGEITEYVEIASQSATECVLRIIDAPTEGAVGELSLIVKKAYNGEVLSSDTLSIMAIIPGVVITKKSNAPVQEALYAAGLVANEGYSLQEEVEKITSAQLQTGTSQTTSIFYKYRWEITHFEEFRYFIGVTEVPKYLFDNCYIERIQLPNTITSIGESAFRGSHLVELNLTEGVVSIRTRAFNDCQRLANINLPSTLKTIEGSSFNNCIALKQISLPEGFESLYNYAFQGCTNLEYIYIPSSMKDITPISFVQTGKLFIDVDVNNGYHTSVEGVVFSKDKTTLEVYTLDKYSPTYTIPEGTKYIGQYAFLYNQNILEISLPSTLQEIRSEVFSYAPKLSTIRSNALNAPLVQSSTFGNYGSGYTGRSTYNLGVNKLYVPMNATGYESGYWLDPLQNADKCGFSIYGRLKITSNKPSATFNVTYVTTNGASKTITMSPTTVYLNDVQYDTEMTISVATGGATEDWTTKTFVYNRDSQEHECMFLIGTWITIDQTVLDPYTRITGDINGEHVQLIRNNSHRYLGKYTAQKTMTICQLKDADSRYFHNGATAILSGEQGDVFMKLPRFWYRTVEKQPDVWNIGFYYGEPVGDMIGWIEWEGNELIGAYKGTDCRYGFYSRSGKIGSGSQSYESYKQLAQNRGDGYTMIKLKHHNIMAFLFCAMYGNTNSQELLGVGLSSSYAYNKQEGASGILDSYGMRLDSRGGQDSSAPVMFWGLENWWGLAGEYFDNFTYKGSNVAEIIEDDGSIRTLEVRNSSAIETASIFYIGEHLDAVAKEDGHVNDRTLGYCDFNQVTFEDLTVFMRCYASYTPSYEDGIFTIKAGKTDSSSVSGSSRLCFKGVIIEEANPDTFIGIPMPSSLDTNLV